MEGSLPRCRWGHRTRPGTDAPEPGTDSWTRRCTRIALTQARCHPGARDLLGRRKACVDGGMEALGILKGRLSDVLYRAL